MRKPLRDPETAQPLRPCGNPRIAPRRERRKAGSDSGDPNLLNGIVPTKNGVTLRAIRAHLALVNVGVAILAILPHIREYRFYVALCALHFLVHAAQRIVRFVVIEFGDRANGAPARSGVAVLARNRERSVRTTRAALLTVGNRSAGRRPGQKHHAQDG